MMGISKTILSLRPDRTSKEWIVAAILYFCISVFLYENSLLRSAACQIFLRQLPLQATKNQTVSPNGTNAGLFITGADDENSFVGIKPASHPPPDDGPVGKLLQSLGRPPFRPAHLHVPITAQEFQKLATHIFVDGDEYIESNAVFGVKGTLVAPYQRSAVGCPFLDRPRRPCRN